MPGALPVTPLLVGAITLLGIGWGIVRTILTLRAIRPARVAVAAPCATGDAREDQH